MNAKQKLHHLYVEWRKQSNLGQFNNFDIKNNASGEVIRDVNFDAVEWHMDDEDIVLVEDVCQIN